MEIVLAEGEELRGEWSYARRYIFFQQKAELAITNKRIIATSLGWRTGVREEILIGDISTIDMGWHRPRFGILIALLFALAVGIFYGYSSILALVPTLFKPYVFFALMGLAIASLIWGVKLIARNRTSFFLEFGPCRLGEEKIMLCLGVSRYPIKKLFRFGAKQMLAIPLRVDRKTVMEIADTLGSLVYAN